MSTFPFHSMEKAAEWTEATAAKASLEGQIRGLKVWREELQGSSDGQASRQITCLTNMIGALEGGCRRVLQQLTSGAVAIAAGNARAEAKSIYDAFIAPPAPATTGMEVQMENAPSQDPEQGVRCEAVDVSLAFMYIQSAFEDAIRSVFNRRAIEVSNASRLAAEQGGPEMLEMLGRMSDETFAAIRLALEEFRSASEVRDAQRFGLREDQNLEFVRACALAVQGIWSKLELTLNNLQVREATQAAVRLWGVRFERAAQEPTLLLEEGMPSVLCEGDEEETPD